MRTFILSAALLAAIEVQAGIYKCEDINGNKTYSSKPCSQEGINNIVKAAKAGEIAKEQEEAEARELKTDAQKRQQKRLIQKSVEMENELKQWRKTTSSDLVYNSPWDGSVAQVDRYLERNLKDPDSLDVIACGNAMTNSKEYRVWCKYRAKNSFGGYVMEAKVYKITLSGVVYSVSEYDGRSVAFY